MVPDRAPVRPLIDAPIAGYGTIVLSMADDVLLLAGTRKGLLLARKRAGTWQADPLALPMTEVYAVAVDTRRSTPRLLAGTTNSHWGPTIVYSDDLGRTWQEQEHAPLAFPADTGAALERVWQLQPGPVDQPEVVYAGTEPTALFRSVDGGLTFELVRSLWDHPHREQWAPGFGGQALHSIVPHPTDPDRILVAMSTGGVYRTRDGGSSWAPSNTGIRAAFMPEPYPEFGQCVHKVAADAGDPERLYAQNHGGVYRSDDWGSSWTSIAEGLPAEFGFPIAADPHRPGRAFVFPLEQDAFRFTPEFRARVYGTEDAGATWSAVGGTPIDGEFYSIVLRDALTMDDDEDEAALYFGTRNGELYAGGSEGWTRIAANLPDVLSVRAAVLR